LFDVRFPSFFRFHFLVHGRCCHFHH
jgi:hypothetical protein